MTEITETPQHWSVESMLAYHADRECESASTIKLYEQDRYGYYLTRVRGVVKPQRAGPDLDFGNAFHVYLTQPNKFDDEVIVLPPGITLQQKAGKAVAEENPQKYVIEADDMMTLQRMEDGVRKNRALEGLLGVAGQGIGNFSELADVEHAVRWVHPTGIKLKVCFDLLLDDGTVIDIKTADNPEIEGYRGFKWRMREYAYHRQAALYCLARDMYRPQWEGHNPPGFYWLVVGKKFPWMSYVYSIESETLDIAKVLNDVTLDDLAATRTFGDQEELWLPKGANVVTSVGLDEWELKRAVLSVGN